LISAKRELLEQIKRIERIDQLIRMKATGTPNSLAKKLVISERSVRRLITIMKNMGAPIYYCHYKKSYYYDQKVHFKFGFYCENGDAEQLHGGFGRASDIFFVFFEQRSNFDRVEKYLWNNNVVNRNSIS